MGNLPVSRTENCVAGAPVNHNLINEIQDMFVGDHHIGRPCVIPACDFTLTSTAGSGVYTAGTSGGFWTHAGGLTLMRLEAPLRFPAGDSIDTIEAFFKRNSTPTNGDTYIVRLMSRTLTVGAAVAAPSQLSTTDTWPFTTNYPNLDHILLTGLPTPALLNTEYWIIYETTIASGLDDVFYGVGYSLSR